MQSALAARMAASATFVTALAFAREANSFCRTVTHAPPDSWNVSADGCFIDSAGGAKALFWKNACVGYSLQSAASRSVTLDQATSVVASAFDAWSSSTCDQGGNPSVHGVDLGPVECGKVQYNRDEGNQNVIFFHDDVWPYGASDSTLGLTTVTFDTATGEILGADIEINATQSLIVGDSVPAGSYNLASVITHEVGHFLGLAHSPESNAVMFAKYMPVPHLSADDVQGLCSIYPPDGSRAATDGTVKGAARDPTPHGGFISACTAPGGTGGTAGPDTNPSSGGCSIGPRSMRSGHAAMAGVGFGLALLSLGRRRFRARTRRATDRLLQSTCRALRLLGIALAAGVFLFAGPARASVSIAIALTELMKASTAAAIVDPIEQRSVWENGRIYSYTKIQVEEIVAGDLPREVWVRTMGGVVGTIGQLVEGEASLSVGQRALVFLRAQRSDAAGADRSAFEVAARAQGHFPIALDDDKRGHLVSSRGVGALVARSDGSDAPATSMARPQWAVDALRGLSVDNAVREIAALWSATHRR